MSAPPSIEEFRKFTAALAWLNAQKNEDAEWIILLIRRLEDKAEKFERAINHIAMLGRGELAYTKDFTEECMKIAHRALTGKERGL